MVVYIDLIFLTNLLIDGALLLTTAWMRKQKPKIWRVSLSAVVGALYCLMMFLPQLSFMYTFLTKFLFSVVMLWLAFGFGSLQNYMRNLGAFYVVNFVAAGGILGIHYLLMSSSELWNGIMFTQSGGMSFRLKVGSIFSLVGFAVVLLGFKAVQNSRQRQERLAAYTGEVEVLIEGHSIHCQGLIDTGNQLTDPLTRMPVMVMEALLWQDVLPSGWKEKLAQGQADNLLLELGEMDVFPWRDRLRLVPYRGINKSSQFMLAMKPDEVRIRVGEQMHVSRRVLIGLDGGKLSAEGAYQAIIHPALVEPGTEQEGSQVSFAKELSTQTGLEAERKSS
ncbi:sigma-E processing peptidase SpoIIGA [Paenibacillus physcomitrellae]|uniref:Sporulation sigma-E factor-processing peptidase n=1 Tax=Paenibacillus physcomitrellae TaxID=1619311 RepID=A0ABQ1FM04_9BACL|nr:sigma-E processing peptidase SpoIIGA [Paenibacillus physcomitrellae]GGA20915.1 sporulation sigma-E factor-processing peptidase [Paenibacillus physcomitrellae]